MNDENTQGECCAELPRYKSHKEVHALKIQSVESTAKPGEESDGSKLLIPVDGSGFAPIRVDHEFVRKHNPQGEGYYVVYKDGYTSWSPVEAFEEGYTLIQ